MQHGLVSEDAVIFEIDDLDKKERAIDRFYELCEKLGIRIQTLEEILELERQQMQEESKIRLGKVQLHDTSYTINDKAYSDTIKLYFNELSKINLLTPDEEKDLTNRVKR
jgi:Sigma-70 factor, region 1.2